MAYTACVSKIASSIQANCESPIVGGYTGRGILMDLAEGFTFTADAQNPRIISAITAPSGTGNTAKFVAIDNVWADAYTGSTTASSADNGRPEYNKTFTFRVPMRGGEVSKDIIEPLMNSALGYAVVLEKMDRSGDGSYEIVGYLKGLKANADGIQRNEYENGGDWTITMSTTENYAEVVLFDTDYETTKGKFDTMLANTY